MRLKKKIKFFADSARAHNLMIDELEKSLKAKAGEYYTGMLEQTIRWKLHEYRLSEHFIQWSTGRPTEEYKKMPAGEFTDNLIRKWSLAKNKAIEFEEWLNNYVIRCKKNKEVLKAMYDKGEIPMFIVLTSLIDSDRIRYCFVYELFDKEEEGVYDAHIFDSKGGADYRIDIDYRLYEVRPMTKDEFERIYLMDRIEHRATPFNCEEDLIEYDNYLRRLFNGQERN